MYKVELLTKYFPDLSTEQVNKYSALGPLYKYWNERINVISRKDIDQIYLHHILHSLAIARFFKFPNGSRVLDVGTGGGFPGLPLAVFFPYVEFTLVDSIGKKIKVVKEICTEIECTNVNAIHTRAENLGFKFDYVVSRAVTSMPRFISWTRGLIEPGEHEGLKHGIIALKGGDLEEELRGLNPKPKIIPISGYFEEDFFATKKIIYLPVK